MQNVLKQLEMSEESQEHQSNTPAPNDEKGSMTVDVSDVQEKESMKVVEEDKHEKESMIVEDTIVDDNNLPSTTMNNQSDDIKDAYMAQPCRAKHPREEQDMPESNQDQEQPSNETPPTSSPPVEQTRASGPMDKFIKSKSPLPAPKENVQRGGKK
jgi:hypothetical protein